ncbi:hypothetical protein KJY73_15450 [Bowmanella sp. Y26]|uniref:hypothetical protein n=1 Tax=Bowmanella yangjiangensis TaxID=2811230 RepID=UPI001BDC474F|nr:hypothetical protein [Bowmanella yangjiangensis]MBT1064986.1 hypothetical protein [Bowmanella yangjiangensis]
MTARKGLSLVIISTFLYFISPQILAKNYLNIEVADEILALGDEYKISFIEGGSSNQTHTVDKKRITFMPENDRVFYEFTLFIEKGEKTWHADLFIFSNQKNFLNFDTLLFSKLVDPSDFYHLSHKDVFNFYTSYQKYIPDDYASIKAEYDKGILNYLDYVSPIKDYQAYSKNILPLQQKLKELASQQTAKNLKPHQDIMQLFIKGINRKNSATLLKYRDPNSPAEHQDIYKRGLDTLFSYFDRMGNPTKFRVIQEKEFKNYNRPSTKYFLIEILEHNGAVRKDVEMEFYFQDAYGKRYIYEYDITGIHFR